MTFFGHLQTFIPVLVVSALQHMVLCNLISLLMEYFCDDNAIL